MRHALMWLPAAAAVVLLGTAAADEQAAAEGKRETIVYTGLRPANWDLYLFDSPGAAPRRLTRDPDLDYNAVFSPDGRWVVFCSERRGSPDLFALDLADPEEPVLLTRSDAMEDAPAFSPDGTQLAFVCTREGNADVWVMPFRPEGPDATDEAVNLTRHPGGDFNPAWSPDGKLVAFSSDRDEYRASEIYVMRSDGAQPRRLTAREGWDGAPAWSRDGSVLYYYSQRDGQARLYRMNADGSEQQAASTASVAALSPAVLPDGRIAFASRRDERSRIVSVADDGNDERNETDLDREYWAPAFDANTGRMVCHGAGPVDESEIHQSSTPGPWLINNRARVTLPDRELALLAVRGYFPSADPTSGHVVTDENFYRVVVHQRQGAKVASVFQPPEGQSAWRPSWSKDGRWIACTAGPTFGAIDARADLWKFRPDGSEAVNLTADSPANDAFPDFSADSRRIVFRSGRDGNHEIYLMDADGTNPRRLTHHDATDTMPAYSPVEDRIAFVSNRDAGDYEIYVLSIPSDGPPPEPRRITNSPRRDTHPKFSPDGRWLVFASERGGLNDEEPLIPVFNPQPYGEIFAVRLADGHLVRLTHNKWEDGTPTWAAK